MHSLQEELALYALLLTVPHQHSAALQKARPPTGSQAGLGMRALGAAFQRETGGSPMRCLRQLRLDPARLDLLSGRCGVTEAATRWGFSNLGHFARHDPQRHGEQPRGLATGHRRARSLPVHRLPARRAAQHPGVAHPCRICDAHSTRTLGLSLLLTGCAGPHPVGLYHHGT